MLLTIPSSAVTQSDAIIHDSRYGGTLVWGTVNPPMIINPVLTSHSVSTSLFSLIFDKLIRIDHLGHVVPDLAKSWDISADGLQYTFHLYPHVYFHDGVECTAEDIKFTLAAISDPINQSSWRSDLALINHLETIDRYTLRIILRQPFPSFLSKLSLGILPEHLYRGTNLFTNAHNYSPVGTGPFRFQSWDRVTNEIILVANPDYFEGRPFLDKIVIKTYQDSTDLWAALMRGEVNLAMFLNHQDYEILSKDPAFKTYQIFNGFYFAIVYNIHDTLLSNYSLRHAINYAIDRKALMQETGMDGVESNGPFCPQSTGFNKNVKTVSYDPLKVQSILTRCGWKLNSEGILEKSGRPLVLTMLVSNSRQSYRQMALVLRQQLSEVGIALKIIYYDDESQLTKDYLARVKPQMWLRMLKGDSDDLSDIVNVWYSSSSESGRLWKYHDKTLDRLFELGRSLPDGPRRDGIYQHIHALIYENQPACFLFFSVMYHAVAASVADTDDFFTMHMPIYQLKDWFINPERRESYGNY